ncbi:paeninodin family lasso peptide [Bacillus pinisoli]|uniref:paeninodin family lasso peptide n=1 Tax=Bacillus pinisoli TaxID=2901866 RepID=UPI001FF35A7D|nr:paeninodin family lasso peptide [Bacillus pinisoli]
MKKKWKPPYLEELDVKLTMNNGRGKGAGGSGDSGDSGDSSDSNDSGDSFGS